MKTLKISDGAHAKLTSLVGRLMAETGKTKTYSDAIEALLSKSVVLSPELLDEVKSFIKKSPQLGYATKEEFIQDAIRFRLTTESEEKTSARHSRARTSEGTREQELERAQSVFLTLKPTKFVY